MERFNHEIPKYSDFNKFDFANIKLYAEKMKEERKNISEEEKEQNKKFKE